MSENHTPNKYSSDTSFGQGELVAYKPSLTVRDVKSPNARSSRPYCWKTDRVHQLLSDNEERYFNYLVWADDVVDIREQFPLEIEKTIEIAKSFEVKHPASKGKNIVMTSDFVVTLKSGKVIARSFKETTSLSKKRTLEKLSIEKEYWEKQGVHWAIVHEKMVDRVIADNISNFMICRDEIVKNDVPAEYIDHILSKVKNSDGCLADILNETDKFLEIDPGYSQKIIKCLIANKQIKVNMKKQFTVFINCSEIELPEVAL